eukprot:5495741-Amphidinium_carterae.1
MTSHARARTQQVPTPTSDNHLNYRALRRLFNHLKVSSSDSALAPFASTSARQTSASASLCSRLNLIHSVD